MYPKVPPYFGREAFVKDQVHIRNAEAAQLARALARQTGKTISEAVLDALGGIASLKVSPRRRIGSRSGARCCAATARA